MKKKIEHLPIRLICILIVAIAFILIPVPAADLFVRIYFDEIAGDNCALYYATDTANAISQDQCIISEIDYEKKLVTFRLDGSFAGHLTSLRLDLPSEMEQLACIKTITVSSAGIIQKEFNPCVFFEKANIAAANDAEITLVHPRNRAYISAESGDPYLVLSTPLVNQIQNCSSHYVLSRIFVCLFVGACCIFAKRKVFTKQ